MILHYKKYFEKFKEIIILKKKYYYYLFEVNGGVGGGVSVIPIPPVSVASIPLLAGEWDLAFSKGGLIGSVI